MTEKRNVLVRKWIDIKNDFKKSWEQVSSEDPETLEENYQDDNFSYIDYDEGFKKNRRKIYNLTEDF